MIDRKEALMSILGDTPETQKFIFYVLSELDKYDAVAESVIPEKMKRTDADFQQIESVYKKAKELFQEIEVMGDAAWVRLTAATYITSSPWGGPPTRERSKIELFDLIFAAGSVLDHQSLKHGEKLTIKDTDIARVRIIATGFRFLLKGYKKSASETSMFYRVVCILLNTQGSPKALIKKACHI